jgi:hypothetical protein
VNEQRKNRVFRAIVWSANVTVEGKHVEVYAMSADDARTQLEAEYGADCTFSIWNEEEANQDRGMK